MSASHPGRSLAPGEVPLVLIVQEAGWAPEPVWTQRLEEKYFRLCRWLNLDRPVVQSDTNLSYPGSMMFPNNLFKYFTRVFNHPVEQKQTAREIHMNPWGTEHWTKWHMQDAIDDQ
jgi:hypothetical protein